MTTTDRTIGDFQDRAIELVRAAVRWIGDEPVKVSAPVDAQVSTTYALLAVTAQLRELTDEVRALRLGRS
jgi:hypothetical protein